MKHHARTLVAVAVLAAAASACSGPPAGTSSTAGAARPSAGSDGARTPEFSGPWADELTQAYLRATTDAQRAILADGQVTDAEYAQVRDGFVRCLADVGYTVEWAPGGGFTLDVGSADVQDSHVQALVTECDTSVRGDVDYVYEQAARNPQNLDEHTIMAACLVRKQVVAASFAARDYTQWFEAPEGTELPFVVDERAAQVAFSECNADPLGLFG